MSENKGKTTPIKSRIGIDLHTHTYYSDGRFSPADLIKAAIEREIRVLAITDHDNTRGVRAAARLIKENNLADVVDLIPGIEFTTRWPGGDLPRQDVNVDLLGYFIDPHNPEFRAFEQAALNDIHDRIRAGCDRLNAKGIPLAMADIYKENPRYGGAMQTVHALVNKKLARDWAEAVRIFDDAWLPGRQSAFTIRSTIEQIHLAGGVAVLAHPTLVRPSGQPLDTRHLAQLVDWGLDGIEIFHYRLDEEARTYFRSLAEPFGLLITGGSDMHGWGRNFDDLGQQPVTIEMVEALRERAAQYSSL